MKYVISFIILIFLGVQIFAQKSVADCSNAIPLCDNNVYTFKKFDGNGQDNDEIGIVDCNENGFPETNSVWFKWQIDKPGLLKLTISPSNPSDDLDFILYKVQDENDYCYNKSVIRCMASGVNIGLNKTESLSCLGDTGLKIKSTDISEEIGCDNQDDNFLQAPKVQKDEQYLLFVNNFSSESGFTLSFSEEVTFKKNQNCEIEISPIQGLKISDEDNLVIGQIFPTPTDNEANIEIYSPITTESIITVYDINGREVQSPQTYSIQEGTQIIGWDTKNLSVGSYVVEVKFEEEKTVRKMVIVDLRDK